MIIEQALLLSDNTATLALMVPSINIGWWHSCLVGEGQTFAAEIVYWYLVEMTQTIPHEYSC